MPQLQTLFGQQERPFPPQTEHHDVWPSAGLRLAARRSSEGMFALGTLLMGVGRKTEGRRWLRAALAHGEGGAACHLGREIEAKSPSRGDPGRGLAAPANPRPRYADVKTELRPAVLLFW